MAIYESLSHTKWECKWAPTLRVHEQEAWVGFYTLHSHFRKQPSETESTREGSESCPCSTVFGYEPRE